MTRQRRRAFAACDRLAFTREERHELAEVLTGHEGSWEFISEQDAGRVADAVDGFLFVMALMMQRAK